MTKVAGISRVWGVAALAIGCASAPTPARVATPPVNVYANIPAEIGAFKLTERTAVSGMPTDSLFRFRDGSRTILSVIIYGIASDVRVDADSQKWTAREGEKFKAVQDIRVNRGQLVAYEVAFADTTRFPVGERRILEHSIATAGRFPNGAIVVDLQYLYQIGGKFVKVRATIPGSEWQQSGVPSFARELAGRIARVP